MAKKRNTAFIAPPPRRQELSDNPVKLCSEIARVFRNKMRESCDMDGVLSQPGARLIMQLLAIEDGLKQKQLVEKTHLRAPTVSVILSRMCGEGLVELRTDGEDRRVTRAYLTEKGRRTDAERIRDIKNLDAVGLCGISESEQELLMTLLLRIRDNLLLSDEESRGETAQR